MIKKGGVFINKFKSDPDNKIMKNYKTLISTFREFKGGWDDLFDDLCKELSQYNVEIVQAKEKHGKLCIHYVFVNDNIDEKTSKEVADITSKWENKSSHICEYCGSLGNIRTEQHYIQCLCDKCFCKIQKFYQRG